MQVFQHIAQLPGPTKHTAFREWAPIAFEQVFQRAAIHILHDQEVARIFGKEVGERGQVGMIQA